MSLIVLESESRKRRKWLDLQRWNWVGNWSNEGY